MVCLLPQAVDRLSWSVVSNPPASSSRKEPRLYRILETADPLFDSYHGSHSCVTLMLPVSLNVLINFRMAEPILMMNTVFRDIIQRGCCKNRRSGGTYRLNHQDDKNRRARNVSSNYTNVVPRSPSYHPDYGSDTFLRNVCSYKNHIMVSDFISKTYFPSVCMSVFLIYIFIEILPTQKFITVKTRWNTND
jgi:hypothetical protein